jgi:hypothetical protein
MSRSPAKEGRIHPVMGGAGSKPNKMNRRIISVCTLCRGGL